MYIPLSPFFFLNILCARCSWEKTAPVNIWSVFHHVLHTKRRLRGCTGNFKGHSRVFHRELIVNYSGNVLFRASRILGVKGKLEHVWSCPFSFSWSSGVWYLAENIWRRIFCGTPAGQILCRSSVNNMWFSKSIFCVLGKKCYFCLVISLLRSI